MSEEIIKCEVCECEHHAAEDCTGVCPECNSTWGKVGHDIPAKFYQVYNGGNIMYDDESLYYAFNGDESVVTVEPTYPNFKANKYGKFVKGEEIKVTIAVNETRKANNPLAHVVIDGKEFDLNVLNSAIDFYMNKDHKISIHWNYNEVETFRFIVLM